MSLSNTNDNGGTTQAEAQRRLMQTGDISEYSESFLEINAFIFMLMGIFLGFYIFVLVFQRNADFCCGTCPRGYFYTN